MSKTTKRKRTKSRPVKIDIPGLIETVTDIHGEIKTLSSSVIVLSRQISELRRESVKKVSSPREKIQNMFAELDGVPMHWATRDFIESLQSDFETVGMLSSNQYLALERNYNWLVNGVPFSTSKT